ncbi:MAG: D-glycero-beta-D-manno-heptose 1,7-bisphosphate 7-phosphatase [Pseudomonadota bacterium]
MAGGDRAVFLDRDGVINRDTGYCYRPDQVEFLPGTLATVARLVERGYRPVIVTNQSGIARGYYTEADFHALMDWMAAQMAAAGAAPAGIYYCPHHPDEGGPHGGPCDCRKPLPGMIRQAVAELGLDPAASLLIGDSERDIAAGQAAGVGLNVLLADPPPAETDADTVLPDLTDPERLLALL